MDFSGGVLEGPPVTIEPIGDTLEFIRSLMELVKPIKRRVDVWVVAPKLHVYIVDLLGNYFVAQPGFFSSVNVTIPQNSTWEIDGLELSHICDVSVEFTFIGKKIPSLENRQYE